MWVCRIIFVNRGKIFFLLSRSEDGSIVRLFACTICGRRSRKRDSFMELSFSKCFCSWNYFLSDTWLKCTIFLNGLLVNFILISFHLLQSHTISVKSKCILKVYKMFYFEDWNLNFKVSSLTMGQVDQKNVNLTSRIRK